MAALDDRTARAVWSRITEPGDPVVGELVARWGAAAALARLHTADPAHGRDWLVRCEGLDPGEDLRRAAKRGLRLIVPDDPCWPVGLDDLGPRRPLCLWVRGDPSTLTHLGAPGHGAAVVGSRAATAYGQRCAGEIAAGLAQRGVTIVSGAAYGIDAAAHRGALAVTGRTVAVLAGGADRAYPAGHAALLDAVAETGAVVSEVPPGVAPTRWRFLQRNRLIAALGTVCVVVEAGWRSGARSTAREAEGLSRSVAAVPGPVTSPASAGCHRLLREGAVCVTGPDEVAELVAPYGEQLILDLPGPPAVHDGLSATEIRVLDAVPLHRPAAVTSLARVAGVDDRAVRLALSRLELRGLVLAESGAWRRAPDPSR